MRLEDALEVGEAGVAEDLREADQRRGLDAGLLGDLLMVPTATSLGCCQRKIAIWRSRLGKWTVPEERTARSSS